ncbi:glutaredoxin family protein [Thioalkalivibrio sp.]|uniref:glutaredoxin family protein n=1 Tax=Thioalkalivibrio sp. TaxID=2093813 RepID=UPI00397592BF
MDRSRRNALLVIALIVAASAAAHWWGRVQHTDTGQAVAALAGPGDLHMYSSDTCPICVDARRWFQRHEVAFTECSIERDPDCRAAFDAMHALGTPVIVIRGQPTLGFDPQAMLARLQQNSGRSL